MKKFRNEIFKNAYLSDGVNHQIILATPQPSSRISGLHRNDGFEEKGRQHVNKL
jgi:hypothetical protein